MSDLNKYSSLDGISQVSAMLGVKPKTVYGWVALDLIPHYKFSKAVRFDLDQVADWAKTCRRGPKLCDNRDTQTVADLEGGANQMGLHKRKNSPFWQASYVVKYPDGHEERKYKSLETTEKEEAVIRFAKILQSIKDGSYFVERKPTPTVAEPIPTVADLINRYLLEEVILHTSKSQVREKSIARNLIIEFGSKLVSELKKSDVRKYRTERISGELKFGGRTVGQPGVKKELSFLRAVWNTALEEWDEDYDGYFARNRINPVSKRTMTRLKENERMRYLTEDEAKKLAPHLPHWLVPIIVAAVDTGLRRENIVNLRVSEVDLTKQRLNIPGVTMKNGSPLPKKMTPRLHAIVEAAIKNRKVKSPYVFIQPDGKPYSCDQVSKAFERACKKAEIEDLHFHDLRHDFATFLINNGATLYQVQLALGQKDGRMAQRYAHLDPNNLNVTDIFGDGGSGAIIAAGAERVDTVLTPVLTLAGKHQEVESTTS